MIAVNKFKVLVAVDDYRVGYLRKHLEDIAEVIVKDLTVEELKEEVKKDYDALVTGIYLPIPKQVIVNASPKLKVIGTLSVGTDHIDIGEAEKRGIVVVNAAFDDMCASKYSVAEHTFALLLTIIKKTHRVRDLMASGQYGWEELKTGPYLKGIELFGKTIGIIGVGRIGTHVARIAHGFRMNIIAYDPYVDREKKWEDFIVLVDDLDELLKKSDVISINAELTEETRGMIGFEEVKKMKDGVYIVNTARGQIVVEEAIIWGLETGKIAGYATDVLSVEPPTMDSSPIYKAFLEGKLNIIITPHTAPLTDKAPERYGRYLAQRIREVLLRR